MVATTIGIGSSRSPRHKVLVVEDYADTAEVMSMLLTALGHDCRCAHTGSDALVQLFSFEPDIVLSDLSLPDLDGCEVARRVRATPHGADAYLVACSGWSRDEDRVRTRAAGFDEHIVKPVPLGALTEIVTRAQRSQRRNLG
jgi:CheY-like chemotaxis protein